MNGDLPVARRRYLADEITLDEFERQVDDALRDRERPPERYSERWEVHVWDAPPGHALHIHLPD
jgi:hypothetical protein